MSSEIIYRSEPYRIRLALSYALIPPLAGIIVWLEYWLIRIMDRSDETALIVLFSFFLFTVFGGPLVILLKYIFTPRPQLLIYSNRLNVGNQTVLFQEIKDIVIDGQNYSRTEGWQEIVVINLKNDGSVTVIVSRYSNGSLFRLVCEKILENISNGKFTISQGELSIHEVVLNTVKFDEMDTGSFQKFESNILLQPSFYGSIIALAAAIFVLLTPIKNAKFTVNLFFFAVFMCGFFTINLLRRYYLVSEKYLVIKNYVYFWMVTIIRIEDIKRIQILYAGSARLVIMTRDYNIHKLVIDTSLFSSKTEEMTEAVKQYIPEYKNEVSVVDRD